MITSTISSSSSTIIHSRKSLHSQDHYFNVQRDGYVIEGELKEYEDSRIKSSDFVVEDELRLCLEDEERMLLEQEKNIIKEQRFRVEEAKRMRLEEDKLLQIAE
ncbi:hypothetical protein Tco_0458091 [Tanacetum coccineum]